jgi:hypothetical protein
MILFNNRYSPQDGACSLMKSIQIRQESEVAMEDIVGNTNIKVKGTDDEKEEAKKRFVVISLPNDGSALFHQIRNCIIQPCPPSEIQDAYKRLKPLLQRYAHQTRSKTLDGMPLEGRVSETCSSKEMMEKKKRLNVRFLEQPTGQTTGSGSESECQEELSESVHHVTNMRKLPKSKCPKTPLLEKGAPLLEKGTIIAGTFSADELKMKPSTLRSLCEGKCPCNVELFVQLSLILGCHQKTQQTLHPTDETPHFFTKKHLVTRELAHTFAEKDRPKGRYYFTESPQHKLSYSFAANQALSKFIGISMFDGEVRQDGDGLLRIVFSKKSDSINFFLFTSFVHLAPVCPSFAVDFCKRRLLSNMLSESDECVELAFARMKEVFANTNETSKCYLLKTQKKVYLGLIPKKGKNSKAHFVEFAFTGV